MADKPNDPLAGYPRLHEIAAAGVPLPTAIAMWNQMVSQLDRGTDYWWNEVKAAASSSKARPNDEALTDNPLALVLSGMKLPATAESPVTRPQEAPSYNHYDPPWLEWYLWTPEAIQSRAEAEEFRKKNQIELRRKQDERAARDCLGMAPTRHLRLAGLHLLSFARGLAVRILAGRVRQ